MTYNPEYRELHEHPELPSARLKRFRRDHPALYSAEALERRRRAAEGSAIALRGRGAWEVLLRSMVNPLELYRANLDCPLASWSATPEQVALDAAMFFWGPSQVVRVSWMPGRGPRRTVR